MVESVQTGLTHAAFVAQESELRESPNGVRFAEFGETNLATADLERMVQAVPNTIASVLLQRAFYFVPLALAERSGDLPKGVSDPGDTLIAAAFSPEWSEQAAVCVVMASAGYPGPCETGREIFGLDKVDPDILVFHAGTALREGKVFSAGGRVLGITALGADFETARKRAYQAVSQIRFDGAHYRRDIAAEAGKWNLA